MSLAGFSAVTGLSQSGISHGKISTVNQPESTQAFAAHLLDAATILQANLDNVVGADGAISRFVGRIGLDNQFGSDAANLELDLRMAQAENPTTNPFMFGQPVAGYVPSLQILNGQFYATDPTRAASEAAAWQSTAAKITGIVSELHGVVASLSGSAETDWVREAIERVNRIQWAGGQYAAHATAMGVHTGNLATVAGAEKIATAAAYSTWLAAPPQGKPILEQAYMTAFTPRLNAGLIPTVPAFNQLLPPLDAMPGTAYQPEGVEAPPTPSFSRSPLPRIVQEALSANGFEEIAYAETPAQVVEQFGNASPQVMDAISAAATPTEAASLATLPSAPMTSAPGSLVTGSLGTGGLGAGAYGQGVNPASTAAGFAPGAFGTGGGAHRAGARRNERKSEAGSALGSALGAAAGTGAAGAMGGFGRGLAGAPGGAIGTGAAPVVPASATGAAGTGAGAQNAGRAVAMGGPMGTGAAGNQGGGARNRKVRAVTSAVERQGNLRALLGEAPAVLPDVIGSNVRGPR
ncbi:hypothetical protein [Corynebacterium qintianiae]|uniref:hypothetical protein n=1 Tax=Corynebacterium qintianiae TaxID=2709392 RepID=UPI0013EA65AA|nr:hypothetical protein [Corynebacterium qintianiae]